LFPNEVDSALAGHDRAGWKLRATLEETDDGIRAIHFNTVLLARFDERDYISTG
jgi:hypothetical protein